MQIRKVKFVLKIYLASLENWYIMYINKFYLFILVEHIYQDEFNYVRLECTVYFEVKGNTFVKKEQEKDISQIISGRSHMAHKGLLLNKALL